MVKVLRAVGDRVTGDALSDRGRVGWHGRELSEARLTGVEPIVVEFAGPGRKQRNPARLVRLRPGPARPGHLMIGQSWTH